MLYTAAQRILETQHKQAAQRLAALKPASANGLTPDAVKFSPEFQAAWQLEKQAMRLLQEFNRTHRKAILAERRTLRKSA